MDNNKLIEEAQRITGKLIEIKDSNKNLESIVEETINKEYKKNTAKIMVYITKFLAEKKYCIVSTDPFKLEQCD